MTDLGNVAPGTPVVVGDRVVEMPELAPGDRIVAVHATGDLLVVPAAEVEIVRGAVERAHASFVDMAHVTDEQISHFFAAFAERLRDDAVWGGIAEANAGDVERAKAKGRSVTRLVATEKMRNAMIDGLEGWAKAPSRRGEVIERREHEDWVVERRRAPLGVIGFVFEGRPNVFADGAGVVRGGNASVMRIGSDALRTAEAIEGNALAPSLAAAALPEGAVTLVRSASHAAAHALFTMPQIRLAIARGSGPAVALLGAIATQHGVPVSLHGVGGAWMYLAGDAREAAARNAITASLDRKVCNTLNVLVVSRRRAHQLVPLALEALRTRDPNYRLHVVAGSELDIPRDLFERRVPVERPEGEAVEPQVDVVPADELRREWEWETTPELTLVCADDDEAAVGLVNAYSPRFVASIITADRERFERFYEQVDAPYVGAGFTRWVDGQWAWDRPELGLTNWQHGRVLGRSGILSGDDIFTVRDVFADLGGEADQVR
jgi:glutamate-5-semialdehyde dehydrogenase